MTDSAMSAPGERAPLQPPGCSEQGKYLYCIIRLAEPRDFGRIGVGGSTQVYTVHQGDLAAVVSDTPIVIYEATRENLLAHDFVNELVMREFTVVPMSFGSVFQSGEDVTELLRSTRQAFSDALDRMRDQVAYSVKVLWDRDRVVEDIERRDEDVRRVKAAISRNTQSSTYFARRELSRLLDAALEDRGNEYVSTVHDRLRRVTVASRSSTPMGERMIMHASFLVERKAGEEFHRQLQTLAAEHADLLTFTSSGPHAPYHFVRIRTGHEPHRAARSASPFRRADGECGR